MNATTLPSDDELIQYVDGTLPTERAAAIRALLEDNPALRGEVDRLRALGARLAELPPPRPDLSARVLEDIHRPTAHMGRLLWLAPVLAAGAVFLVVRTGDDELTARGEGKRNVDVTVRIANATRDTHDTRDPGDTRETNGSAPLREGQVVTSPLRLLVDVNALPSPDGPRAIAVWARDASGAITWLRPAFTDAARPPSCERLPDAAASLVATDGVELTAATGALAIAFVVLPPDRCDVRALDEALERGESVNALGGPTATVR